MPVPLARDLDAAPEARGRSGTDCPDCERALVHVDGCVRCRECGYSKCD